VLRNISFSVARNSLIGIFGPSNSGKTTRSKLSSTLGFCRRARFTGEVLINGESVAAMRIRMRFAAHWHGLPVAGGSAADYLRKRRLCAASHGHHHQSPLGRKSSTLPAPIVLWTKSQDRLEMLGTRLSGGQQQRLTLARALSLSPEILCLDEFSIAMIRSHHAHRGVLKELRKTITIVLVTNLVQQARRLAIQSMFPPRIRNGRA